MNNENSYKIQKKILSCYFYALIKINCKLVKCWLIYGFKLRKTKTKKKIFFFDIMTIKSLKGAVVNFNLHQQTLKEIESLFEIVGFL